MAVDRTEEREWSRAQGKPTGKGKARTTRAPGHKSAVGNGKIPGNGGNGLRVSPRAHGRCEAIPGNGENGLRGSRERRRRTGNVSSYWGQGRLNRGRAGSNRERK